MKRRPLSKPKRRPSATYNSIEGEEEELLAKRGVATLLEKRTTGSLSRPLPWSSRGSQEKIRTIYLHTRVMYVGDIDLRTQSFGCSFDLHVSWYPSDALTADFLPIIRFPEAVTHSESMRLDIGGDYDNELAGYRTTVEGRFRCALDLSMFPFDAQPLMVEMQLGRCKNSGTQLTYTSGFRLAHHPTEPNILVNQIDSEHTFRPCRFSLCLTGVLESADTMCKYELWVPVERNPIHYVTNHYLFIFLVCTLDCTLPYCLPIDDISNRVMTVLTLYLLLVTYKYAVSGALPVLPYNTALDRYILWMFFITSLSLGSLFFVHDNHKANARMQRWLVGISLVVHGIVFMEVHAAKRTRLLCVSRAGTIDPVMKNLLLMNGVALNAMGLVADPEKYHDLLSSQPIPITGGDYHGRGSAF
mmetsp:Transcript_8692/g.16831  ORF Transcript_8692/g.16831 Transcript_8692/m.16831 type:complete len:415 (+) Transcript_8692:94-1338(+)